MADSDIFSSITPYEMSVRHEALELARAAAAKLKCGMIVHYLDGRITEITITSALPSSEIREYPHGE